MSHDPSFLPRDERASTNGSDGTGQRALPPADFHVPVPLRPIGAPVRPPGVVEQLAPRPEPTAGSRHGTNEAAPIAAPPPPPRIQAVSPLASPRPKFTPPPTNNRAATVQSASQSPLSGLHVPVSSERVIDGAAGGITFLPGSAHERSIFRRREIQMLIGALIVTFVVVVGAAIAMRLAVVQTGENFAAVARERVQLERQAAEYSVSLDAYRVLARRATAVQDILEQHRAWRPFFRLMEKRTMPDVRYESLTADASGSVAVSVVAPDLRTAAAQVVAWQQSDGVSNVEIGPMSTTVDALGVVRGVRFDLRLRVVPENFSASSPVGSVVFDDSKLPPTASAVAQ
ncbi:MAG: hypothetical protein V1723_02640 [Candidatus Uhrbacteria bacterium]